MKFRLKRSHLILLTLNIILFTLIVLLMGRISKKDSEDLYVLYNGSNSLHDQKIMNQKLSINAKNKYINTATEMSSSSVNYKDIPTNLNMSTNIYTQHAIEINEYIFKAALSIVNDERINTPKELRDPFLYLAMNFMEYSSQVDKDMPMAAALPRQAFNDISEVTIEQIENFGFVEMLKIYNGETGYSSKYFMVGCKYPVGPFQMYYSFGLNGIDETLLRYPQDELTRISALKAASNPIYTTIEKISSMQVGAGYKLDPSLQGQGRGDRYNFNDAFVRTVNQHAFDYRNASSHIKIEVEKGNRYFNAALIALNHNVGQSVLINAKTATDRGNFLKGYPNKGATYGDVFNYASWLGNPEVVAYIRERVKSDLSNGHRTKRPSTAFMNDLISSQGHKLDPHTFTIMSQSTGDTIGFNLEPPLAALVVVYATIRLELITEGY